MSEVYYFQRYYTKENAHSSNALLLLKRVYFYSPKIFYKVLSAWTERDEDEFLPAFIAQGKGNASVPDFCIRQNGFELIVEAKEKNNCFSQDQLERHLKAFQSDSSVKILVVLSPSFNESDRVKFDSIKSKITNVIAITYLELYETIKNVCDEKRDFELIELLEEYRDYCNDENLIDDTNNTIMVRLAGDTIDFNVKDENRIYYDRFEHRYEGFRYLALYNNKSIKYIGKIAKIIKAYKNDNGEVFMKGLVPHDCKITSEESCRVLNALKNQEILYDNTLIPHCYFLVEKFEPVENFTKSSKYALFGRKKFYLSQFGLSKNCSAAEIAEAMKNKTWEEIEQN